MSIPTDASPAFIQALRDWGALRDRGLNADTPEGAAALDRLVALSPRSLVDEMHCKAQEMGLVPEPCGYRTTDGDPVYSIEDVCTRLGTSMPEALAIIARAEAAGIPMLVPTADVSRIQ